MTFQLFRWGFRRKLSRPLALNSLSQSIQRTSLSPKKKLQKFTSAYPKRKVLKIFRHVIIRRSHLKYRARGGTNDFKFTKAIICSLNGTMRCHGQGNLFARSYSTLSLSKNLFRGASLSDHSRQSIFHSIRIRASDPFSYLFIHLELDLKTPRTREII